MKYKKRNNSLHIQLQGDFNLNTVHQINELLDDCEEVRIDLSLVRFADSESIIFLHKLMQSGKKIRLKDPPKIFFEVLQILGLHTIWDLKTVVEP